MMQRRTALALFATCCAAAAAVPTVFAQRAAAPEAAMAEAARAFLATLEPAQRQKASFAFTDDERLNWHFIPKERKGLPLKEMTPPQREAALALLKTGVSQRGFEKAATIRGLESILHVVEKGAGPVRDPERYFFTVFGEPKAGGTWAWRYEGHHCAMNWTVIKGSSVASSPQFFGSNPAEVRVDVPNAPPRGTKVLAEEEDAARALLASLDEAQRKEAILSAEAPRDIITGATRQAAIQEDKGLAYGKLKPEQQRLMLALIRVYTGKQPQALARQRVQKLRQAGLDNVKFAWLGSTEKDQGHYYRVQGPTFLIEYDNTQNNANHVHAVWRDFKGDFGMDMLAMHYQASPHRVAAR